MKHTVTDEAVKEYAERIRNSVPLGTLFPGKMSDCEFTDQQREVIRMARNEKKIRFRQAKHITKPKQSKSDVKSDTPVKKQVIKPLSKLRKMLYLQSNRCFFCGEILNEGDASIEHLMPISKGGVRTEDNEVVCHKSLNETFGHMDLKSKVGFILKQAGNFKCPKIIG